MNGVAFDSPQVFYGVGSRTGIAISPADERFRGERVTRGTSSDTVRPGAPS